MYQRLQRYQLVREAQKMPFFIDNVVLAMMPLRPNQCRELPNILTKRRSGSRKSENGHDLVDMKPIRQIDFLADQLVINL